MPRLLRHPLAAILIAAGAAVLFASPAGAQSVSVADLPGAQVRLFNRWNCGSDYRCNYQLSFSGNTLVIAPAPPGSSLPEVPWSLQPVGGTTDQFYLRTRWHCAQNDASCDKHLSFTGLAALLYPAGNTADLVPWKFVPVAGTTNEFYLQNRWGCPSDSRCGYNLSFTGTTLELYPANDPGNHVPWRVKVIPQGEEYVDLQAKHSNGILQVGGQGNGAAIVQGFLAGSSTYDGASSFVFLPQGDGYFKIRNRDTGKCLEVAGASLANYAPIQQNNCSGGDNQRFEPLDQGDGIYRISAKHSQKCLDVQGYSYSAGAALIQYGCNSADNQRFRKVAKSSWQDLAAKFAPRLRFDGAAPNYPMSAQVFFDAAVLPPNRQTSSGRTQNTSYAGIANGEVPTYYQVTDCGAQVRIKYWWFYGYQPDCDGVSGEHNGDWEQVMVLLSQDRSQVAAMVYWAHGDPYTRLAGDFELEGNHPVVYAGKNTHASYFEQGGAGNCLFWEDWRNNTTGSHMDTWRNLVQLDSGIGPLVLDSGTAPWMVADRSGGFVWGWDGVSTHPTLARPTCSMPAAPADGGTFGAMLHSKCKWGDVQDDVSTCIQHCASGYTDGGWLCTNWSTLHTYSKNRYSLSYTLPITDFGLTTFEPYEP